jgi:hypothetical protein
LLSNFSIKAAADVASIRQELATAAAAKQSMPGIYEAIRTPSFGALSGAATLIHGVAGSADRIQEWVERRRIYNWHWAKPRNQRQHRDRKKDWQGLFRPAPRRRRAGCVNGHPSIGTEC